MERNYVRVLDYYGDKSIKKKILLLKSLDISVVLISTRSELGE